MWPLFLTFLKIGACTFGGGYAMIPLIKKELVENKKWIEEKDILDIIAIAESTPGPIAINAATFVGSKLHGFGGAFMATLGVVLPSFFIIIAISFVLGLMWDNPIVQYAFWGIRAGVLALIVNAFWSMYKQCPKEWVAYLIAIAAFAVVTFTKINVIFVIIGCAFLGIATFEIARGRAK